MSTIGLLRPCFLIISYNGIKTPRINPRVHGYWTMSVNSRSSDTKKEKEPSEELKKFSIPKLETTTPSKLQFDRLQPQDQGFVQENRLELGQFVAREAQLDEEYRAAAWLRAESHWEDRGNERYANNYERKFAEQEYNALKKRSKAQLGHKSTCVVVVKKEDIDVKHTMLKSVVGTLDLSIQYLSYGETFPGERVKAPLFCCIDRKASNRYGYIENLCVTKSARRQGIASNMLRFAIQSATGDGAEQVFVHVHRANRPAQELYYKIGFEVVEAANLNQSEEQIYLLCFGS